MIDGWDISCEIALIWMSLDFTDDQSTLVQVMAWCRQAKSHYLNHCWPRSPTPYVVTRPQWVDSSVQSHDSWGISELTVLVHSKILSKTECQCTFGLRSTMNNLCLWIVLPIYLINHKQDAVQPQKETHAYIARAWCKPIPAAVSRWLNARSSRRTTEFIVNLILR